MKQEPGYSLPNASLFDDPKWVTEFRRVLRHMDSLIGRNKTLSEVAGAMVDAESKDDGTALQMMRATKQLMNVHMNTLIRVIDIERKERAITQPKSPTKKN